MSVKRRDIIKYLEKNGFFFLREGGKHAIYVNGKGLVVPVKRHKTFNRFSANKICKEAFLEQIF